jgi:uncharacterized integral membrane protein
LKLTETLGNRRGFATLLFMRIFSTIFAFITFVLVVSFALSNGQPVAIGMWPFQGSVEAPLYAASLIPLIAGLFIGGLFGWASGIPHRRRAKQADKELSSLKGKLGELTGSAQKPKPKSFWSR